MVIRKSKLGLNSHFLTSFWNTNTQIILQNQPDWLIFRFDRTGHQKLAKSSFSWFSTRMSSINKIFVKTSPSTNFSLISVWLLMVLHVDLFLRYCDKVSSIDRDFQHFQMLKKKKNKNRMSSPKAQDVKQNREECTFLQHLSSWEDKSSWIF